MVVAVLQGSVRSERMGHRAAKWVLGQLGARGHEAVLVDAAALELPLLDKMWKEIKRDPSPQFAALYSKLAALAELYAHATDTWWCAGSTITAFHPRLYQPDRSLDRGVRVSSGGDRLLFGRRFRRGASGHATARAPARSGIEYHSFPCNRFRQSAAPSARTRSLSDGRSRRRSSRTFSVSSNGTCVR